MSINQEEKLHAVALVRLLEGLSQVFPHSRFGLIREEGRSSYALSGYLDFRQRLLPQVAFGVFIKVSHKRKGPWSYSFRSTHQDQLAYLKEVYQQAFIVLVNGDDGIACVDFSGFKEVLDQYHEEQEWVRVSRKPNQGYRLSGNDGRLDKPLPKKAFPYVIVEYLKQAARDDG
jgi:hypothetical protein